MKKIEIEKIKDELIQYLNHASYDAFIQSDDAYKYAEILNKLITYCAYCNIESIETVRKDAGIKGQRADFDHFIKKNGTTDNDLNYKNLVPSCHHCNSRYKGNQKLSTEILDPFENDFDSLARFDFDIDIDNIGSYKKNKIDIIVITKEEPLKSKTEQTIKVFNLINRYNADSTKQDLQDFFNNLKLTTDFKKKDYMSLNITENLIKESIFNYKNCDINKTRYGKLKKDLFELYIDKTSSKLI